VVAAEFEEKEYEVAADIELSTSSSPFCSTGQVLEGVLGYDAYGDPPQRHRIWTLLRLPRPRGVFLTPRLWTPGLAPSGSRLPTKPVSLIIQYKRPEYLRGGRARQWQMWRAPYFRFERTRSQHTVLRRIERGMGPDALVRYAAPAFWTAASLEAARLARLVLASSGFVAPATLDGHTVWTYQQPGLDGRANPRGGWRPFATIEDVLNAAMSESGSTSDGQLEPASGFSDHLERLAITVGRREPALRRSVAEWVSRLVQTGVISPQAATVLGNFATVQSAMRRLGASWYVADRAAR
jgi:hypothetical protein